MKNTKKIIIKLFMSFVFIFILSNYTDQNLSAKAAGLENDELFRKAGEESIKQSEINNAKNYKESQEYYKTHSKDTVTSPKPYTDLKVSNPNNDLYKTDKDVSKANNKAKIKSIKSKIKSQEKRINKNKSKIKTLKSKNISLNVKVKLNKINKENKLLSDQITKYRKEINKLNKNI